MKKLLIATTRKGKIDEFLGILKDLRFEFLSLKDINFPEIEPEETGKNFAENSQIKARFYGTKTDLLTLADDSGLLVKALPGKLGIKTKRYAPGTDKNRYLKLLQEMKNFSGEKRKAQFVAAVSLYNPQKHAIVKTTLGICEGQISFRPKGKNGFGFDPVFVVAKLSTHFAQLTLEEKNKISHRALALLKIKPWLKKYEN